MGNKKVKQNKKLSLPLRILMVAIIFATVFLCVAILSESEEPIDSSAIYSSNAEETESTNECVLVDNETIKASFVGAEDASSLGVFYITLKIENKTNYDLAINLEDADVDGETIPLITTGVPLVIRPGNSGQTGFIFSMVDLSISTMDDAKAATFQIVARDNETFNTVYESELVTVNLH